jgi:hypothetical protein
MSKKKSQTERILDWLQKGKSITPLQAWERFGSYRLSSVINRLRKKGHNIVTEIKEYNGSRYANYKKV